MNDEKNTTTNADKQQPRAEEALPAQPGELGAQADQGARDGAERDRGIMLMDRPPRPGTIEPPVEVTFSYPDTTDVTLALE